MPDTNVKMLISRGLTATKAAAELAMRTTSEVERDATDSDLVSALQAAVKTYDQWGRRIDRALDEVGEAGNSDPVVLRTIYEAGRKIRQDAADSMNRDLEIIQNGQLALHTWIVTFGVLRTYASHLSMSQTEQDMRISLEEAKQADAHQTAIAERILGAVA